MDKKTYETWKPNQMGYAKDIIKTIAIWTHQIKATDLTHLQAKDQNHGYLWRKSHQPKKGWLGLVYFANLQSKLLWYFKIVWPSNFFCINQHIGLDKHTRIIKYNIN